jgi:hypothetical protein
MFRNCLFAVLISLGIFAAEVYAEPLAEKYLQEGRLADGEKALVEQLKKTPQDDQARFSLGVVQFLEAYEHLGTSLYRYGLRTQRAFRMMPLELRELLPQNPQPEKLTYAAVRQMLQTFVKDLERAEATLAAVKDPAVKLPLHVGKIKLDLFGLGKPVDARVIFARTGAELPAEAVDEFVIGFDRGDVNWLRGYCHFLCALGEVLLAVDGQEIFDCSGHLFFENIESPHAFLQEEPRRLDSVMTADRPVISDIIAFIHLWRFPIKEPQRMNAAIKHLETMLVQAREMWKYYLLETDDEHEWIPNPHQKGVMQVEVSQEMLDAWLATLAECDLVLQGKRLVPFWRGTKADRGVNVRRIFTEPRSIDPILWVQGTAATPYLEKGKLTNFADPRTLNQLSRTFGGMNFFGFAFWFN